MPEAPLITCSKCRQNKTGADPVRWLCVDCATHPVVVTCKEVDELFDRVDAMQPLAPGMRVGDTFTMAGRYARRKGWWPALLEMLGFYQASRSTELQRFRVLDDVTAEPGAVIRYESDND